VQLIVNLSNTPLGFGRACANPENEVSPKWLRVFLYLFQPQRPRRAQSFSFFFLRALRVLSGLTLFLKPQRPLRAQSFFFFFFLRALGVLSGLTLFF